MPVRWGRFVRPLMPTSHNFLFFGPAPAPLHLISRFQESMTRQLRDMGGLDVEVESKLPSEEGQGRRRVGPWVGGPWGSELQTVRVIVCIGGWCGTVA